MIPNILTSFGVVINLLVVRLLSHILPPAAVEVISGIFSTLAFVMGTPIFLLNAILCHVIEPVVIGIRRACGYTGMMQLH